MNRAPPSAIVSPPTLEEVIALVRRISGDHKTPINAGTRLEEDLHITGDDGVELLEAAEQAFGVSFFGDGVDFMELFELKENEYLFTAEGLDLLGLDRLCRWLRNEPEPVVADLSVGKLHRIVVACKAQHCAK